LLARREHRAHLSPLRELRLAKTQPEQSGSIVTEGQDSRGLDLAARPLVEERVRSLRRQVKR
jgi:hypothetical protein